jgi:thioredoxin:protein disulfide reductase
MISLECQISSAADIFRAVTGAREARMLAGGEVLRRQPRKPSMRRIGRFCPLLLLFLALCGTRIAPAAEDQFLPPEQVFKYTVTSDGANVAVHWSLPPGYYAYKARMALESATAGATLGAAVYPQGEVHKDEYFGAQEVFRGAFTVSAPVNLASGAPHGVLLKLKIQGCADAGLCYFSPR